ncbi:hypothetical protein C7212DRAFT_333236 [Tuber magnatum]|uniref:Uncharacterized protein n=1 Tax=Tuber magnatum TaxID=42249 RepID=A0A317SGD3_9PEZI|nr:hypothetical protein C7212DRAFT_333236 [Tuber magnatum]
MLGRRQRSPEGRPPSGIPPRPSVHKHSSRPFLRVRRILHESLILFDGAWGRNHRLPAHTRNLHYHRLLLELSYEGTPIPTSVTGTQPAKSIKPPTSSSSGFLNHRHRPGTRTLSAARARTPPCAGAPMGYTLLPPPALTRQVWPQRRGRVAPAQLRCESGQFGQLGGAE